MTQDPPGPTLPRLTLVRETTDRLVVERLLTDGELTRAALASRTGISKPTVSEAVRRLVAASVLVESGAGPSGRRGPSGTLYGLRSDVGVALAASAGPGGVVVEIHDVRGTRISRRRQAVPSPTTAAELEPVLRREVEAAVRAAPGPVLAAGLSVAGPVEKTDGRLVHLPDSPFLIDELSPRPLLADLLGKGAEVLQVDNDVNWAALAEHHEGSATDLDDFCFCYLGPGIGAGLVTGGQLLRGHRGLAGELAHVRTVGPDDRALRLIECLRTWGLLRPGSAAIDVDRVVDLLAGRSAADRRLTTALARAVAGALASAVVLLDPAGVVVGGPWGGVPGFAAQVGRELSELAPVPTQVRTAAFGDDAPLVGARIEAVRAARAQLLGRTP